MEKYKRFTPTVCESYHNRGQFDCVCEAVGDDWAVMRRLPDDWIMTCYGLIQYENGTIEWDRSIHGHWMNGRPTQHS
jgi:hypothetical protein